MAKSSAPPPEQKPKKKPNMIGNFFKKMTEEEKKVWYKEQGEKRKKTYALQAETLRNAREKAKELLPEILAQDMLMSEQDNYQPRQETLDKLRGLINAGLTTDEMRTRYFKGMTDKGWEKITKFLFKSHHVNAETIGLDITSVKLQLIKTLKTRVRTYKAEIREYKKANKSSKKKFVPLSLMDMLARAEDELFRVEMDFAKAMTHLGVVGDKSKSPSIIIHTTVPRPAAPSNEPRDVTPPKQRLSDILQD